MSRLAVRRRVVRWRDGVADAGPDELAAEEPMEIRVNGTALTVTMRTPGHDFDLAVGLLVAEGVISSADDLHEVRYCAGIQEDRTNTYNIVDVTLAPGVPGPSPELTRHLYTTSACGMCGTTSLETVRQTSRWDVAADPVELPQSLLAALPERLRAVQRTFDRTGGLHAAALFTADGDLIEAREDVGRHNAVDKVIGSALLAGRLPARGTVLMVSGRASFELVQKAAMAGIPVLAAVSAPSSLAVDLAEDQGLTLVGFLRGSSMNVYARADRIRST